MGDVLDHLEFVAPGNSHDRIHVSRVGQIVHNQDGFGPVSDPFFKISRIKAKCLWIYIGKNHCRTQGKHRQG